MHTHHQYYYGTHCIVPSLLVSLTRTAAFSALCKVQESYSLIPLIMFLNDFFCGPPVSLYDSYFGLDYPGAHSLDYIGYYVTKLKPYPGDVTESHPLRISKRMPQVGHIDIWLQRGKRTRHVQNAFLCLHRPIVITFFVMCLYILHRSWARTDATGELLQRSRQVVPQSIFSQVGIWTLVLKRFV
jgi:hypothetical protein